MNFFFIKTVVILHEHVHQRAVSGGVQGCRKSTVVHLSASGLKGDWGGGLF